MYKVVTKRALLTDPGEHWPLWPCKVGQTKNPGIMSCILIRCTHDKQIWSWSSYLIRNCVFCFGPLVTKPRIRLDRNWVCQVIWPRGTKCTTFHITSPGEDDPGNIYSNLLALSWLAGGHIWSPIGPKFGRNVYGVKTHVHTMLECFRSNSNETCQLTVPFWTLTSVTWESRLNQ
jgi:hypothetical protein